MGPFRFMVMMAQLKLPAKGFLLMHMWRPEGMTFLCGSALAWLMLFHLKEMTQICWR